MGGATFRCAGGGGGRGLLLRSTRRQQQRGGEVSVFFYVPCLICRVIRYRVPSSYALKKSKHSSFHPGFLQAFFVNGAFPKT